MYYEIDMDGWANISDDVRKLITSHMSLWFVSSNSYILNSSTGFTSNGLGMYLTRNSKDMTSSLKDNPSWIHINDIKQTTPEDVILGVVSKYYIDSVKEWDKYAI